MLLEKGRKEEGHKNLIMYGPSYVSITVKTIRARTYQQQSVFGGFDYPIKFNLMNQLKFVVTDTATI